MRRKIHKGKLVRNSLLLILVIGIVGIYFSNRFAKSKGFSSVFDLISTYRENKGMVDFADTKELSLIIKDKDYDFIKAKREEALQRGIQINVGDNYVKCKVALNQDTVKGEMRLKGHMTDHLEGDKWSFRVKTKEDVMGMYRFSLQNPATRNYAYEWVYHQLLKKEGIIHLKYDFVRLKLNEKDLGVYAVEEHFGQHIPADNERPKGAILRWNPELFWAWRINEMEGEYLNEQYSSFSSSFVEPYDRGVVGKDEQLMETYLIGAKLLEEFRRGEMVTSEVFDIELMAKFHAVIDIVGGYHSLDWSDVKFFYNTDTGKIEPVGYESFSIRETEKIAGQRIPPDYDQIGFNYHDRLFSDPVFFEEYIKALDRMCTEAYFEQFTQSIEEELKEKRGTLAEEFAYIKFSYQGYYENIERIRYNIELPKAFHAFVENRTDSSVQISVAPVSDYPIEIIGLSLDGGKLINPETPFVIPPKARDTYAHYFDLTFNTSKKVKKAILKARIPGGSTIFEVSVSDLPSYRLLLDQKDSTKTLNNKIDTALVWLNDSIATIKGNEITGRISIPENTVLRISQKESLNFGKNASIQVEGGIEIIGQDDQPILITSSENKAPSIDLKGGEFTAVQTIFLGLSSTFLKVEEGDISLQTCQFADIESSFIEAENSTFTAINCASGSLYSLGSFDRCEVKIKSFTGNKGNTFITSYGSDVEIRSSQFDGYERFSVLNYVSNLSTWSSTFKNVGLMGSLNNHSSFNCFAGLIQSTKKGFEIDLDTNLSGQSTYSLYKTNSTIEKLEERKEV